MSSPRTDSRTASVAAVAAVFFANGAVYGSWIPRLPEVRDRAGMSLATTGLVLSGAAVFALLSTLFAGRLTDRFGSRRAVVVSGLISVIGLATIGAAASPAAFLLALAVVSASDVVQDVAMNVQATQLSRSRSVPIVSRMHGLWSLGSVVGGMVAAWLAATSFSLAGHLLTVAVLLAAATIAAASFLAPADDPPIEPVRHGGRRRVLGRAGLGLAVVGFLATAIELNPADWSAIRLAEDLDASSGRAALGFGVFSAGMVVGRLAGDGVVHRFGARTTLVGGITIAAAGMAVATLTGEVSMSIIGFAIAGLGVGPVFPQIYATAAATPGLGAGSGIAVMMTGQRVGALLLPVAIGILADLDRLSVGEAVALITLPSALVLAVVARRARPVPVDAGRLHR